MTLTEALRLGAGRLAEAGIDQPRIEARLLLACALRRDAAWIVGNPNADAGDAFAFDALLARRAAREPLAYILGRREFWSLNFQVSPATLIPRADSETVVEAALAACPMRAPRVLDLGTGTGCLLLAVLRERPEGIGFGVDIAPEAVTLAARNARNLGMADRAMFIRGDWDAAIYGTFDLILSNPPYIPSDEIPSLMPEVASHEPRAALDGGADGFDAYRQILASLPRLLRVDGAAVLELGMGQAETAGRLASDAGYKVELRTDLAGIWRAMVLRYGMA